MSDLYIISTPSEVSKADGIHLLTFSTPNGQKVQILLEELALLYGIGWTTSFISIMQNEQKEDWYLRLNPNGKIPVIVDNTNKGNPFPVIETSAEMLYLADKYDKDYAVSFQDPLERSQMIQWLFFWHGSGAPPYGQLMYFGKFAKEKIPAAIERFRNETLRVFGVLEIHLSGKNSDGQPREYLAGSGKGKYSLADIGAWPWVAKWEFAGFEKQDMEAFPNVLAWLERIGQREAVKTGTGDKYQKKP
ncbi:glutathione S-transferase, partial [Aureobasidium melanogenum]